MVELAGEPSSIWGIKTAVKQREVELGKACKDIKRMATLLLRTASRSRDCGGVVSQLWSSHISYGVMLKEYGFIVATRK
jgi:hypothetical protein